MQSLRSDGVAAAPDFKAALDTVNRGLAQASTGKAAGNGTTVQDWGDNVARNKALAERFPELYGQIDTWGEGAASQVWANASADERTEIEDFLFGENEQRNVAIRENTSYSGYFVDGEFSRWYLEDATASERTDVAAYLQQTDDAAAPSGTDVELPDVANLQAGIEDIGGGRSQNLFEHAGYTGDPQDFAEWYAAQGSAKQSQIDDLIRHGGSKPKWGHGWPQQPTTEHLTWRIHGSRDLDSLTEPFSERNNDFGWRAYFDVPGEYTTDSGPMNLELKPEFSWSDYYAAAPKVGWNNPMGRDEWKLAVGEQLGPNANNSEFVHALLSLQEVSE